MKELRFDARQRISSKPPGSSRMFCKKLRRFKQDETRKDRVKNPLTIFIYNECNSVIYYDISNVRYYVILFKSTFEHLNICMFEHYNILYGKHYYVIYF